jgi:Protein of unknown function (DUF3298).
MKRLVRVILPFTLSAIMLFAAAGCQKKASAKDTPSLPTESKPVSNVGNIKADFGKESANIKLEENMSEENTSEKNTSEKNTSVPSPQLSDESIKVEIKEKVDKRETDTISIDMKYPEVSGLENKAIEKKINEIFEKDAVNLRDSLEKDSIEFKKSLEGTDMEFRKYGVGSSFEVKYNKNNILSIPVVYYQYTGGAHGGNNKVGYNFDLTTGKQLELSELFEANFDYKKVISEIVLKEMKANPDWYFPEAFDKIEESIEKRPYYLEEGNLVVYYGEYEIAPYAAGIREFKIPFSMLKFNRKLQVG